MTPALIPVRWGSKGLRFKNLRKINGKSLLQITVEAIQNCTADIVPWVAADSNQLLRHAANLGAQTYLRSDESATDQASTDFIIKEWLAHLTSMGAITDQFLLVQVTNPSVSSQWIDNAHTKFLERNRCEDQVSCIFTSKPFHGFLWRESENSLTGLNHDSKQLRSRRQDIEYVDHFENGSVYVISTDDFFKTGSRFGLNPKSIMVDDYLPEIDTHRDYDIHVKLSKDSNGANTDKKRKLKIKLLEEGVLFVDLDGIFAGNMKTKQPNLSQAYTEIYDAKTLVNELLTRGYTIVSIFSEKPPIEIIDLLNDVGVPQIQTTDKLCSAVLFCEENKKFITESVLAGGDLDAMSVVGKSVSSSCESKQLIEVSDHVLPSCEGIAFLRKVFESVQNGLYET